VKVFDFYIHTAIYLKFALLIVFDEKRPTEVSAGRLLFAL